MLLLGYFLRPVIAQSALEYVEEKKPAVLADLLQRTGLQWQFDIASIEWQRANPVIELARLQACVPNRPVVLEGGSQGQDSDKDNKETPGQRVAERCSLAIDNLQVVIDPIASLMHRKPLFYAVHADSLELVFSRSMQGVYLAGMRSGQQQQSLELETWLATLRQLQLKRGVVGFVGGDLDWQTKRDWPAHQIHYACRPASGVLNVAPVTRDAEALDIALVGDNWKKRKCLSRDWRGFVKADYSSRSTATQSDEANTSRVVSYTDFTATVEPDAGKSHLFAKLSTSPNQKHSKNSEESEGQTPFWTPLLLEGELSFSAMASYFSDNAQAGQWLSMKWYPLDVTGVRGNVPIGEGFLSLGVEGERGAEISIQQGRVDLPTLIRQVDILYRPEEKLRSVMRKLNPRGSAEYLRLRLPIAKPADFQLEAELRDVSVDGVNAKAISAQNVSGWLSLKRLGGVLKLDRSKQYSNIRFPTTYDERIWFSPKNATVNWAFENGRIYIAGHKLNLEYIPSIDEPDRKPVPLVGSFFVNSRLTKRSTPSSMDLEIGIESGLIGEMLRFVPDNASPATRRWIAQSGAVGQGEDIGFIYRGSLKPDLRSQRMFMLGAKLSNTSLRFATAWPQLRETAGVLYIDSDTTSAEIESTSVADISAEQLTASIDFTKAGSDLTLSGDFSSTLEGVMSSLLQTPVANAIPDTIKGWDMRGQMRGELSLAMPLSGLSSGASSAINDPAGQQDADLWNAMTLEMRSDITDAKLSLPEQDITIDKLRGPLDFSSRRGFSSDGLQANLWSRPIAISLRSPDAVRKSGATQIASSAWRGDVVVKAEGPVNADSVKRWLGIPGALPAVGSAYTNFEYSYVGGSAKLAMNSNLRGIEIDLPEPFVKEASEAMQFDLLFAERQGIESRTASIDRWVTVDANRFQAESEARYVATLFPSTGRREGNGAAKISALALGEDEPAHRLTITGRLPVVDLGQWTTLFEQLFPSTEENLANSDSEAINGSGDNGADPVDLTDLAFKGLDIDSFLIAGNEIRDVSVAAGFTANNLDLSVVQSQIQGQMVMPLALLPELQGCEPAAGLGGIAANNGRMSSAVASSGVLMPSLPSLDAFAERVVLDMDVVDLALFTASDSQDSSLVGDLSQTEEEKSVFNNQFFQPGCLPAASVRIAELRSGERAFGAWRFLHTASDSVALLHDVAGEFAGLNFRTNTDDGLLWAADNAGKVSTSLTADVATSEIERAIQTLGNIPKSPLFAESSDVSVSLHWQDAPHRLTLNALNGVANFDLQNGRFVEVPSVASGFLKLVSAVNLQRYISRLQLDLSDLYEDGLGFDELSGAIDFDHGQLRFEEKPVSMKASSSNFTLSGSVDLKENTIDGQLVTTLPVASNLPWIAALAGGLPVAAGTFIATQALDSELKRLSSVVYTVEGSLQEPEIALMTVFDDGKAEKSSDGGKRKKIKHHRRR